MSGANLCGEGCCFRVSAPRVKTLLLRTPGHPDRPMHRGKGGVFTLTAEVRAGDRYFYVPDGKQPLPDPVSRLLPEGVHGPSEVVDPDEFHWTDGTWRGLDLRDYVIYELHVGTFSQQGTFAGVIERLDYLKRLGITAIELMPVAAFPGERNWGYDGVSPYAVQASYGGPSELKRLVDAAHCAGIAVVLDVVYNHLGNEGNYLRRFAPYFTARHKTPWGDAVNYDETGSEGVRNYVVENARYWIREYHMDGLRLDAVQTIHDSSPQHVLGEIQEAVQAVAAQMGRKVCVIAESDENDARLVRAQSSGGYGLDAVWSDDFHHAVHAALTAERQGYYQDFGALGQVVRALNEGFVFQGDHFHFWGRPRGTPAAAMQLPQHVICLQNHDQVGNRAQGERLSALVPAGAQKLAAALLLVAPHTPLLFMGEEYGETAPFQFFTSYGDPVLAAAVSRGRSHEFKDFNPQEVPDPQDPETFLRSKLNWKLAVSGNSMLLWYQALIRLRKTYVMPAKRACHAQLLTAGSILMQVPEEQPQVAVLAEFRNSESAWQPEGAQWNLALRNDEDGFRVSVFVRRS